jgi:VanZ family protein
MSKKSFQIILIVYLFAILVVSTVPGGAIPKINIWSFDKILHIVEYFILAFLMINTLKIPTVRYILLIIIIGIVYGGFNEVWQGVIAHRYASIYDAVANGIGMVIGSIVTVKFLLLSYD